MISNFNSIPKRYFILFIFIYVISKNSSQTLNIQTNRTLEVQQADEDGFNQYDTSYYVQNNNLIATTVPQTSDR